MIMIIITIATKLNSAGAPTCLPCINMKKMTIMANIPDRVAVIRLMFNPKIFFAQILLCLHIFYKHQRNAYFLKIIYERLFFYD